MDPLRLLLLTLFATLLGIGAGTICGIAKVVLPVLHVCDVAVAELLPRDSEDYDTILSTRMPEKVVRDIPRLESLSTNS